ncbi:hypothetical protein Tco_1023332 [Tanacetum coccineum]
MVSILLKNDISKRLAKTLLVLARFANHSYYSGTSILAFQSKESYMRQCRLQKRHNVLSFWPWATPSLLSRSLRADVYGSLFQQSERRSVPGHKSFVSECPLAADVQAM